MQFDALLLIWILCILLSISQAFITIFHQKIQTKIQFKQYSVAYFGNLISLAIVLMLLISLSQDLLILIFEVIGISLFQFYLWFFVRKIWNKEINLYLFLFSGVFFGGFRFLIEIPFLNLLAAKYPGAFQEILNNLSISTYIFYSVFLTLYLPLIFSFILYFFIKILTNRSTYRIISNTFWVFLLIFAISPLIDQLSYQMGQPPFFYIEIWDFMGKSVGQLTYGTIFQFTTLVIMSIFLAFYLGRKYGINFQLKPDQSNKESPIRYIAVCVLITVFLWICFVLISLISFNIPIIFIVSDTFGFTTATHPFWFLSLIYFVLLSFPMFCGFLIYYFIKNRKSIWDNPNLFNRTPFFNILFLISFGFFLGITELKYEAGPYYFNNDFILFVLLFYLIIFLIPFGCYISTFKNRSWINISGSLKSMLFFIPFLVGYFIAGPILTIPELFLGLMGCASLQIFAASLYSPKTNHKNQKTSYLYWFSLLFWSILAIFFAGILSIISLIFMFVCIILLYLAEAVFLEKKKLKSLLFLLTYGIILLMGGISQTFFTELNPFGIPNTLVFSAFAFFLIIIAFYLYEK